MKIPTFPGFHTIKMVDFPASELLELQEGKFTFLYQNLRYVQLSTRTDHFHHRWTCFTLWSEGVEMKRKKIAADFLWSVNWVWPPHRIPVTTKIITCLIGNPYKPSFTTVTVRGPHPKCESKRPCYCAVFFATWMFMMSHWRFLKHPEPVDPMKVSGGKMFFQRLLLLASGSVADLQGI